MFLEKLRTLVTSFATIVFCKKQFLVTYLEENRLTLAYAVKQRKTLICSQIVQINLSNRELSQYKIYKPPAIIKHIKKYAQDHFSTKPQLIVYCSSLLNDNNYYALMQIAICMSKSGMIIKYLTGSTDSAKPLTTWAQTATSMSIPYPTSKNMLEFLLPPTHKHSLLLATHAVIIITFSVTVLVKLLWQAQAEAHTLATKIAMTATETKSIQAKVTALHEIKQKNIVLIDKIATIKNLTTAPLNCHKLLDAVVQHIPEKSALCTIECTIPTSTENKQLHKFGEKKKRSNEPLQKYESPCHISVALKGETLYPDEICVFAKMLSEHPLQPNMHFSLINLSKNKSRESNKKRISTAHYPVYAFTIQGESLDPGNINSIKAR